MLNNVNYQYWLKLFLRASTYENENLKIQVLEIHGIEIRNLLRKAKFFGLNNWKAQRKRLFFCARYSYMSMLSP